MRNTLDEIFEDAQRRGLFDDLPGRGEPIDLEEDPNVPPELRTMYRILKHNNISPGEVQELQRIANLEKKLHMVKDTEMRARIQREISTRRATVEARLARLRERR